MLLNKAGPEADLWVLGGKLFEPISNILLKRMRPRIYIPLIMVLWGICMTFMGFCHNFSGMMAARWFVPRRKSSYSFFPFSPTGQRGC